MNRRNPETQRWQFYHPAFQRDRPHLRNNIKRKSARSVNTAPTYSRVVFERDKGYYVQQESSTRPFNGQGSHNRSNNSEHSQEQHRPSHSHGASQAGSIPHHYNPHTSQVHRSPHESLQRPPVPRPDYRPHAGHPGEPIHPRDEKDHMPSNHQIGSPHQHIARVDHDTQHHQQYPGPHYHSQQQHQHQSHPYASPHQHQYSYNGPPSQAHHPSEHGYSHKSQSFNSHNPPPPESHHAGPPLPHTAGTGRLTHQGHGYHSSREPGYPDYSHDVKHGTTMGGGHFRSQSAPGSDPRRVESSRGPHPFNQQEVPRSPPHTGSQPYYSRESYPPPMSPHRRHQGSIDENSGPSRRYSPPPGTGMGLSQPGQQQRPPSGLGAVEEAQLAAPNMDPASNPSSHDLIPHGIKQMESRLHFVEDAYMSLRHFAQELQNIQVSQEQTIAWMRDRIEQLTEVGTPRGKNYLSLSYQRVCNIQDTSRNSHELLFRYNI
ncbi:hypothetical protein BCR41DRAFT_86492 [Lobosporangium transversale]|uniref:Uncharacterized protein n=1 Tax=Lobosporangium transversale TaxID=64571 RepID=A0A1Y2GLA0_9FUNG|nr:hypothetical protein BCR41DRAFT_86492 [Lobosporangium transversale]ORZ14392.1 hypothetical protein BCR41DRAFT_86492 [Lobosporangium transversale]|eukprot:XP_021880870.1 hypothetical protein BCR41DRAFT_86492 [Lobosporangium transversale]